MDKLPERECSISHYTNKKGDRKYSVTMSQSILDQTLDGSFDLIQYIKEQLAAKGVDV